jgi:hypothetical protein
MTFDHYSAFGNHLNTNKTSYTKSSRNTGPSTYGSDYRGGIRYFRKSGIMNDPNRNHISPPPFVSLN